MSEPQTPEVDAVVIGAGFGGIYMLHKLRNGLGLNVRAYDKAGGVGGTWYWNKYPGALSDTEAHIYQYSFDKEISPGLGLEEPILEPSRHPRLPPGRGRAP